MQSRAQKPSVIVISQQLLSDTSWYLDHTSGLCKGADQIKHWLLTNNFIKNDNQTHATLRSQTTRSLKKHGKICALIRSSKKYLIRVKMASADSFFFVIVRIRPFQRSAPLNGTWIRYGLCLVFVIYNCQLEVRANMLCCVQFIISLSLVWRLTRCTLIYPCTCR